MKFSYIASCLVLMLALFSFSMSFSAAASSTSVCGLYNMSDNASGYGGVVTCGIAYACGVADGVCPEKYSSGGSEMNDNKTNIYTRYEEVSTITYDFDLIVHDNGTAACDSVAGTCSDIERYSSGSWSSYPGEDCSSLTSTLNGEVRAVCNNVPMTASCYNCPDPDCSTEFNFLVYDEADNSTLNNSIVSFNSVNEEYNDTGRTNENGTITFSNGATGIFNYLCSAVGYSEYEASHYMQHNLNSLHCPLQCQPEVTSASDVDPYYTSGDENRPLPSEFNCVIPSPDNSSLVCSNNCVSGTCDSIPDRCIGEEAGVTRFTGTDSDGNLTYGQCCDRPPIVVQSKGFEVNPVSDDVEISNLLTRSYRKQINERPVTLKIITYEVE